MLVDVSKINLGVNLFGRDHAFPLLLAPTGYHQLVHQRGEFETIAGANLADCTLVASCFANIAFEEVQRVAKRPQWFQLYVQADRGLTRCLIEKVLASGCEAICLTVDLAVNAKRDREEIAKFELPITMTRGNLVSVGSKEANALHSLQSDSIYNPVRAANLTWKDIEWLRSIVDVPLLLKGVLHPEDAATAVKSGCDGVIVSNHGGRALDGVSATIDALPSDCRAGWGPMHRVCRWWYSQRYRYRESFGFRSERGTGGSPIFIRHGNWWSAGDREGDSFA